MVLTKHVLVIDDERDTAELLKAFLESRDYAVTVAYGGEEGIEKAERQRFDLVILDVMLPGMDGFETCAALKVMSGYKYVPVLMLTAKSGMDDQEKAFAKGAGGYMVKPFEMKVLLRKMRELLLKFK